jgi:hypothetical protein
MSGLLLHLCYSVSEDAPNYLATQLATSVAGSGMDDRIFIPNSERNHFSLEQIPGEQQWRRGSLLAGGKHG